MIGASLSRWTMSYFAAALLALVAAELMMTFGYGFPHAALQAPETLVLVHLVAIGWLSLLMCGALFQFVPVLVARPLYSDGLPLQTLILLVSGLFALICGFLQLAGTINAKAPFFALAGVLLGFGFGLVLWNLGRTLLAARPLTLPARFVAVGLASIAATATLGIVFALVLGGATYEPMLALAGSGVPVHIIAGLGGWLTFTAMGVSYRLLAMFMLAPELDRRSTKTALYLGMIALAVVIIGGSAAILLDGNLDEVLLAAALFGLAALVFYAIDVIHLYRARKRRKIELNSRISLLAFASLAAAIILMVVLLGTGELAARIGAVVFLVAFGWLSGLGLAQLFKITAFLTWLECYGPVLGKTSTPRVQDLVVESRAGKWFLLYFLAVWVGTAALIAGNSGVFQATAAAMFFATCGIATEIIRIRRLADVALGLRLPRGTQRPSLLYAVAHQS